MTLEAASAPANFPPAPVVAGEMVTGEFAVRSSSNKAIRRQLLLHEIYSPVSRRVLLQAGLKPGMQVADFGCGIGTTTRLLAKMVGTFGSVTAIDSSETQMVQTGRLCEEAGMKNVAFWMADVCDTHLPANTFDLVYCRFLLIHLANPDACLREMRRVLKPGGILVVEDGDLGSAGSVPGTALNVFGELFTRLGPKRGVDYLLGKDLFQRVNRAGFTAADIEIHQPACARGENRALLKWSLEEAGPGCVSAGLLTEQQLDRTLAEMQAAMDDPDVLVLLPRVSLVWARKGYC